LAGIAAASCALACSASAAVIRSDSILPPGESGFVSIAGLASGSGSPHLYDQTPLFTSFRYRNAMLSQPGGTEEDPRAGVKIVRDAFGVPSVTGDTSSNLWWGAGYATAQDRLFELEIFKRVGDGTLAEITGKAQLGMDVVDRRDFYTPAEVDKGIAALPQEFQQRYADYTAGVNAWVDHVLMNPNDMPGEYPAVGIAPSHFSVADLVRIGIYLARQTPNGDGEEIDNMNAIDASGPRVFDRLLPLRIRGQVSTIPRANGLFPSVPGRTRAQERAALRRSYAFVKTLPVPSGKDLGTEPAFQDPSASGGAGTALRLPTPIRHGGSYMVAIGDRRHHHAWFFNGPELGWLAPEELYEIELHGPGLDVRGITAPGAPVVAIGHNEHVAFGLTSGLTMTNHLYAEKLVPGQPDAYYYKGQVRQMDCRDENFAWKTPPSSLLGGGTPDSGSVSYKLCRTVHGPVQTRAGGYAYARRYAPWMQEAQTLIGLSQVDTAATVQDVDKALANVTWNENMEAADDHGSIGYWHPGLLPESPKNWDERLPYPGDGSAEWRGFLPVAQRPHVINPKIGYLTNWNTLPSQGWTTGNDPASERVAGPWFRDAYLKKLAGQLARSHPTFDGLEKLVQTAGTTAQQRVLGTKLLHRAAHGSSGNAGTVLATVLGWDGNYNRTTADGTVDPGAAAWLELRDQMQKLAIAPLGKAGEIIGAEAPNDEHDFDVSIGQAYALRTLSLAQIRRAAADAYDELAARFKTDDPRKWRAPRDMFAQMALGAEQPPPMPFFDRGTFEEFIELH
jgi:acyl-homoserine lactone acylase PvdQ